MQLLTLQHTAQRIIYGTQPDIAIKEHIDVWNKSNDPLLHFEEPILTGHDMLDAWLASAAHYQAFLIDNDPPDWVMAESRFLKRPYFMGGQYSRMIALVETPFAFRMRLLFTGQTTIRSL